MKFKYDFVREQFAAFSEPSLKRWAHFENAGGSYMADAVAKRLRHYQRAHRVQPYHPYPAAKEAGQEMDEAYDVLAKIMNVDEAWVYIGPSSSANTYTLAHAFGEIAKTGQNIIVTNQDHEANSGAWRRLAKQGIEVREWSVNGDGFLEIEKLKALIDENTLFAAFPHVSNIIGEINPVAEITALLREKGVYSVVDGVSYAPHAWPNIAELGADVYFFSAYKTYATHQGVMAINPELAAKLPVQAHGFNDGERRKRLIPAGPDHAQVAALAGLEDYIGSVYERHHKERKGLSEMTQEVSRLQRKYETKQLDALIEELRGLNQSRILGSTSSENRVPTISLYHESENGVKLAKKLSKHQIMAGGGHFYSPRVFEAMGLDAGRGVLRLSFVHYIAPSEIEQLVKALHKLDKD